MRLPGVLFLGVLLLSMTQFTFAASVGSLRGVVHDAQHHPVENAMVMVRAKNSDFAVTANTDTNGQFMFNGLDLGEYTVTVAAPGFNQASQSVEIVSGSQPVVHFLLTVAGAKETVTVSEGAEAIPTDTVTPTTMISRLDIQDTPGADRTNSVAMITDYVPAAYVAHDMLHMRGGHQVNWLINGVPVPNTNIATNIGPQIDPKDIDYLEVDRGSYESDLGDRTYGIFNIVPRTGFERDRECDLVMSLGNFYQTNDQISCGNHSQRSAYYVSLNGNRSNYGLMTPVPQIYHDAENGFGGFASFISNLDSRNQIRVVGSLRRDYYQVPIDPNPSSWGNRALVAAFESPSYDLRDSESEPDGYAVFSWVRTFNPGTLLTVSPFYHYNGADYHGGPNDLPVISSVNQNANYGGAQASLSATLGKNDLQAGIYGFVQHQYNYFNNVFTCHQNCQVFNEPPNGLPTSNFGPSSVGVTGGVADLFIDDKYKPVPWLTLIAGLRESGFSAAFTTARTDPRVGIAVQVPHLNWVFRGFYGYYYQAPPLSTATGPLIALATNQDFGGFATLHGEKDIEWQLGVTIPYHGWILDADNFATRARNWLDHNNIGESNLFWPITWDGALIQGWELTLRSPDLGHHGQLHLSYSNQVALATSPITGGLICPAPATPACPLYVPPGLAPVDHDQRNTLNVGFNGNLPWHSYASTNVYYGSGLTNGLFGTQYSQAPGMYLPGHTTVDLALGKTFAERYSVSVDALNLANRRVLVDTSLTFGGFHWNDPREIYVEFRYRFRY
jgi:hypothetical protein